jgi:hypothetical protein
LGYSAAIESLKMKTKNLSNEKTMVHPQNLWVASGSGKSPSV